MPQEKRIIFLGSRRLRRQPLCHWSTGNDDVPDGRPQMSAREDRGSGHVISWKILARFFSTDCKGVKMAERAR